MAVSLDATKELFKAFADKPFKSMYIKEIENKINLSYERVQHYLGELEKEHLVYGVVKGRIKEYSINKNHELIPKVFAILEMEKRHEFAKTNPRLFSQLRDFIKKILIPMALPISFILLFGSAARGEAKEASDIDILIVLKNKKRTNLLLKVKEFNETWDTKFAAHVIIIYELRKKWGTEPVYSNIWKDRIVLYGEENFWNEILELGEPR